MNSRRKGGKKIVIKKENMMKRNINATKKTPIVYLKLLKTKNYLNLSNFYELLHR